MTNNELLSAISDLFDRKLKAELQPIKDDLQVLNGRFDVLEQRFDGLEQRFDGLEQNVESLNSRMERLEERTTRIELILENETNRNIRILAENYVPAAKRYEKATMQIETMQADIDVLKRVVASHSEKLQMLA